MSIGYDKPGYEYFTPTPWFDAKVQGWIDSRVCKWKNALAQNNVMPSTSDYHLILGQCVGDSTNTRMDFGDYMVKLHAVIKELLRVDSRDIVVKLHPYMDGKLHEHAKFMDLAVQGLKAYGERVAIITGMCSTHPWIENCRDVILANSGAALEVMMHDKPIIAWGKPEYHWVCNDLRHLCDLHRAITLDWFDAVKQRKYLYWFTEHFCITNTESAIRRVKEIIDGA